MTNDHESRLCTYPSDVLNPEETDDDVVVGRPGEQLHRHWPELLQPRLGPILQARLRGRDEWRGDE